jgi:hypothetical protein
MSQTRSKSVADSSGMERILEEISGKLSTLCSKYDLLTAAFQDMETQTKCYREKVELLLSKSSDVNRVTSEEFNNQEYRTNAQEIVREWSEINLEKEAYKKRSQIKGQWFKLLNERKQAYWNALKNENLADTYEEWKNRENVIFPRKFRVKIIDSEPSEETKIRIQLALQKFETEITLLRLRVPKFKSKYEKCDLEITELINRECNGRIREKLLDLWRQDTKREEEKSHDVLQSKIAWLLNYESKYGTEETKPKMDRKMHRNNRNKKKQFRGNPDPRPERTHENPNPSYAEIVKKGIQSQSYGRFTRHQTGRPKFRQNHSNHFTQRKGANTNPGRNSRSNYDQEKNHFHQNHSQNHFLGQGWSQKKRKKGQIFNRKRNLLNQNSRTLK